MTLIHIGSRNKKDFIGFLLKLGTEQLANLLKNIKANLHNKALGHYREMAWLPFQKAGQKIQQAVTFVTVFEC